jgi:hypothetical protein
MVKVIFNNGSYYPTVECCQCHQPIMLDDNRSDINRKTAKALFKRDGTVTFAHQTCDDDSYEIWEPLDTFIYRLLHNTGLTQKRLKKAMEFDFWGTSVKKSAVGVAKAASVREQAA